MGIFFCILSDALKQAYGADSLLFTAALHFLCVHGIIVKLYCTMME